MDKDRLQFIADIANGEWVDRLDHSNPKKDQIFEEMFEKMEAAKQSFIKNSTNPEELHAFVDMYNWDDGCSVLKKVAENPACDLKTALLIFWNAEPSFYQEYSKKEELSFGQDSWELIHYLMKEVSSGRFGDSKLKMNIKAVSGEPYTSEKHKWSIPGEMYGDAIND